MRGTQIARQWKILRLLESRRRGVSAAELASELEVPIRTVYRDLEALLEAGFPLYNEKIEKGSHWKIVEGFKADLPLPLTTTELMSLHMSRDLLRVFEGTVFQESIESLFAKVKTSLPPETARYLESISGRVSVGFGVGKDYTVFRNTICRLSDATAKKTQVEIIYSALSTGQETLRKVDPYQVWAMNGCFYLIGRCHLRNAVRTFAMDRIKEFRTLTDCFHLPKDFSLEDYLQTAFRVMTGKPEKVRVWFRASAAQVVKERIWHPSQEIRDGEDGSVVITMQVPINYEVISWVLGFGSAARVLQPISLKENILNELAASLEGYGEEQDKMENFDDRKKTQGRVS